MIIQGDNKHISPGSRIKSFNDYNVNPVTADRLLDHYFAETDTGPTIHVEKDGVSLKPGDQVSLPLIKNVSPARYTHGDISLDTLWHLWKKSEIIHNAIS